MFVLLFECGIEELPLLASLWWEEFLRYWLAAIVEVPPVAPVDDGSNAGIAWKLDIMLWLLSEGPRLRIAIPASNAFY